jgi:hypothetical protein
MLKNAICCMLLLLDIAFGFMPNMQLYNNINSKPTIKINRRICFKYIPIIVSPIVLAKTVCAEEKSIEELRKEAYNIIEIIDAQKEAFNLPNIKESNSGVNNKESSGEIKDIKIILNNIFNSFKNDNATVAITNLKEYCAPSNPIKSQKVVNLIESFNNTKYAILLGKFYNYSILTYNSDIDSDTNTTYYNVDVKVEADYKTMIYNSVQFDEMYYPESNPNNNNMCYVIYRWIFKLMEDDKYYLDGCYMLRK